MILKNYLIFTDFKLKKINKMKTQNIIGIGIIMSLLIIFTGCPLECVTEQPIKQTVEILPKIDTIHIGDTLLFNSKFNAYYEVSGDNIDISDREIDIFCYLNKYNNDNPFYSDIYITTGINNFEFNLKKGIIKNADVLQDELGEKKQFYYELLDGKFEVEFEIVAKDTGNYMLKLFSSPNIKYGAKHCEENFSVGYSFKIPEKHKLNDYLIRDTTGIDKSSFYAFVVVE